MKLKSYIAIGMVLCSGCLMSCTFGGSLKTFGENFGTANYSKQPPGAKVRVTPLSKELMVTSEGEAVCEQLDYTPADGSVHIKGLHMSSNPTPIVKAAGEIATANAKEYDVYAATHGHESDNQKEEFMAGAQVAGDAAKALLPLLTGPLSPAKGAGILAGFKNAGLDPQQLIGLLGGLIGKSSAIPGTPQSMIEQNWNLLTNEQQDAVAQNLKLKVLAKRAKMASAGE